MNTKTYTNMYKHATKHMDLRKAEKDSLETTL